MLSVSLRRLVSALALACLLGLPSLALAAPHGQVQAERGVLAQIWSFFQRLWRTEGMMIDPNGSHAASTPGRTTMTHLSGAEGMMIDPDGAHLSSPNGTRQVSGDAGMMIDPDGSH